MTEKKVTQNAPTGNIFNAIATVLIVAVVAVGYIGAIADLPVTV